MAQNFWWLSIALWVLKWKGIIQIHSPAGYRNYLPNNLLRFPAYHSSHRDFTASWSNGFHYWPVQGINRFVFVLRWNQFFEPGTDWAHFCPLPMRTTTTKTPAFFLTWYLKTSLCHVFLHQVKLRALPLFLGHDLWVRFSWSLLLSKCEARSSPDLSSGFSRATLPACLLYLPTGCFQDFAVQISRISQSLHCPLNKAMIILSLVCLKDTREV